MSKVIRIVGAIALLFAVALFASGCGKTEQGAPATKGAKETPVAQAGEPQTTCPVMGGPINKAIYADYQGKRVYFCCDGCLGTFKQDPEKYIKKLADQGVTLEKAPAEGG